MQLQDLDLSHLFTEIAPGDGKYQATGMICCYEDHYMAIIWLPNRQQWYSFDDTTVQCVGQWTDVMQKCTRGRLQPL